MSVDTGGVGPASPTMRDGLIAAEIEAARVAVETLTGAVGSLVEHARGADAEEHAELYENVHALLASATADLERAHIWMASGEPYACDRCGTVYDEGRGDGYCGLCPRCADETEPGGGD